MTRSIPSAHGSLPVLLVMVACVGCGPSDDSPLQATVEMPRGESEAFAGLAIEQMAADESAMDLAGRLFGARCASCHGADGTGKQGIMDLVEGVYSYGSSVDAIRDTIARGRKGTMPALGNQLGEMELSWLVTYVESLSYDEPLSRFGERGKDQYTESCEICHGVAGRGMPELGAPNLADDYWLHGSRTMTIRLIITRGVESECPPQAGNLTPEEIDLLTAYVSGLHGGNTPN